MNNAIIYSTTATYSASSELKMTAATPIEDRAAFDISKINTGIKADGTTKQTLVNWMLQAKYNASKVTGFVLSYQEFTGKDKGAFFEVAKLIPCLKTGLTLQIRKESRITQVEIKKVATIFTNLSAAERHVNQGTLPRSFYLMAYVHSLANVSIGSDLDSFVQTSAVDPTVWKMVETEVLPQKFPTLYGLSVRESLPLSEPTVKIIEGKPETLESLSNLSLQQRCKDLKVNIEPGITSEAMIKALKDLETPEAVKTPEVVKTPKTPKTSKVAEVATV